MNGCSRHLDRCEVAVAQLFSKLQHMLGGNAECAEAMQNGPLKANFPADCGINVQRIVVPVQSVKGGLVG